MRKLGQSEGHFYSERWCNVPLDTSQGDSWNWNDPNAIIIALTIHVMVPILPQPETLLGSILIIASSGIILVGIGSAMYLTSNLGPGPRDGWMTTVNESPTFPLAGLE